MKNIELKADVSDFTRVRRILRRLRARREPGTLAQTDRYFEVPNGRLKLRRLEGATGGELIFYVRADETKPRTSEYQTLVTSDAAGLLRLLKAMFEPGETVRKRRELWLIGDTRIHLDEVARLGRFLEIEAPVTRGPARARQAMRSLVAELGIARTDVIAGSYSDMLARRMRNGRRAIRW